MPENQDKDALWADLKSCENPREMLCKVEVGKSSDVGSNVEFRVAGVGVAR